MTWDEWAIMVRVGTVYHNGRVGNNEMSRTKVFVLRDKLATGAEVAEVCRKRR